MAEAVAQRLRAGQPLEDADFDRLYPDWAQALSKIHWTPLEVARRAAELLVPRAGARVLDVGAGIGKLCLVGALTTQGVFYGIEQRFRLVSAGRATAARLGVKNARFLHGNMMAISWASFDAFYLYNPFAENLTSIREPMDRTVDLDVSLFRRYVKFVRQQLGRAQPGTRVVTYHGFGGEMPPSYRLELEESCGSDRVELWLKVRGGEA